MEFFERALLRKFLDDNYTPEEWQDIQLLLRRPEAQEVLEALTREEWVRDAEPAGKEERRMMKGWQRRLDVGLGWKQEKTVIVRMPARSFLRVAAVWIGIILATGLAVAYLQGTNVRKEKARVAWRHIINGAGVPVRYILPDGSEVYLGAASGLSYPTGFDGDERRIELEGEAFFRVVHGAAKPFVVYTGNVKTTDIGTSFKIEAYQGQPVTVAVASGKVSVSAQKNGSNRELAVLTPGRTVSWDSTAGRASAGDEDVYNLDRWSAGDLIFERETMGDVARTLGRRFGIRIVLEDSTIVRYRVSGTFSAKQPVADILKMLSMLGKFHYEPDGRSGFLITQIK